MVIRLWLKLFSPIITPCDGLYASRLACLWYLVHFVFIKYYMTNANFISLRYFPVIFVYYFLKGWSNLWCSKAINDHMDLQGNCFNSSSYLLVLSLSISISVSFNFLFFVLFYTTDFFSETHEMILGQWRGIWCQLRSEIFCVAIRSFYKYYKMRKQYCWIIEN